MNILASKQRDYHVVERGISVGGNTDLLLRPRPRGDKQTIVGKSGRLSWVKNSTIDPAIVQKSHEDHCYAGSSHDDVDQIPTQKVDFVLPILLAAQERGVIGTSLSWGTFLVAITASAYLDGGIGTVLSTSQSEREKIFTETPGTR